MVGYILIVVGVVALGVVAGRWLFTKDTEVEDRRRAANRTAGILREKGLELIPSFLEDYGVGDYSGMAKKMKDAAVLLSNPASVDAEFEKVWEKLLAKKLSSPEELAKVEASIAARRAPPASPPSA